MKKIWINKIYFLLNYIIPVVLIAGIIFYLSNQSGLGSFLYNPLEVWLRKGVHVFEYGLLTFLVWRMLFSGYKISRKKVCFWSVLLVVLYAISDEFHQTFVSHRTGKAIDVFVDTLGVLFVVNILLIRVKIKQGMSYKKHFWWLLGILTCFVLVVAVMSYQAFIDGQTKKNEELLKIKIEARTRRGGNIDDSIKSAKETVLLNDDCVDVNQKNLKSALTSYNEEQVKFKNTRGKIMDKQKCSLLGSQLPEKVLIKDVPFTTQSPYAKWDQLHEEACEEASLIMLKYYTNKKQLDKTIAEKEIQDLVRYQLNKYGDYFDTDIATTTEIGKDYYKLDNLRIIQNFIIDDLKKELACGNLILVPTAGRELHNPYFTPPGPFYHNLVIIGYDNSFNFQTGKPENVFIVNDPGTRRGQNYQYNQQILYEAIHDFPGDINKISTGSKRAIVLVVNKMRDGKIQK